MTNHLSRLAMFARLVSLLGTSYFLIATSRPPERVDARMQICVHPEEALTFQVSGTCGPAGTITVRSPVDECLIMVEGAAAVGLPAAGHFTDFSGSRRVSLLTYHWTLSDIVPDPANAAVPTPPDAGGFTVVDAKPVTDAAPIVDAGDETPAFDAGDATPTFDSGDAQAMTFDADDAQAPTFGTVKVDASTFGTVKVDAYVASGTMTATFHPVPTTRTCNFNPSTKNQPQLNCTAQKSCTVNLVKQ